ncbi:hypothetical protein ACFQJC_17255 [Haloferax namakaokahaiae]|uniref:Uncharacterized protein n=1 Tax=Haloferax namakaokahaiae TaxID=1748331 RepID=A0ABD5ZIX0_9EURY
MGHQPAPRATPCPERAASTQAGFASDDRVYEGVVTDSVLGAGAPGCCE